MVEATVEELVGYINGNAKRKQVIDVLVKKGGEPFEIIEKTMRVPKLMLEKTLKDLIEKGVVKKQKDKYVLTESGAAAATILHAMR